jgi:hypothetical protein
MADLDLWNLLHAGDWACAHGDDESLSRICESLAGRLDDGTLRTHARRVAALAMRDLDAASELWSQLADRVRSSSSVSTPNV